MLDLAKIPKDLDECPQLLVSATSDQINICVFSDGTHGPTKNAMFVDNIFLADIYPTYDQPCPPVLRHFFTLLGQPDITLQNSTLSMTKYKENE